MENDLEGEFALLPNGEAVIIESIEASDPATAIVRRIWGERAGTRAICAVSGLEMSEGENDIQELV
jgi:hypothetical protein